MRHPSHCLLYGVVVVLKIVCRGGAFFYEDFPFVFAGTPPSKRTCRAGRRRSAIWISCCSSVTTLLRSIQLRTRKRIPRQYLWKERRSKWLEYFTLSVCSIGLPGYALSRGLSQVWERRVRLHPWSVSRQTE